jgi:large subunit ribosomal protein L5
MADDKKAKAGAPAGEAKPKAPKAEKGEGAPKAPKAAKGGRGGKGAGTGPQAGPVVQERPRGPAEKPRLARHYTEKVRSALVEKFKYKSAMQAPRFEKIVINMGVGDAIQDQKLLDAAVIELTQISGQRPAIRRARKSISNFKLREGVPIGCAVTLRGARMYEFYDRLISVAVPRIRDFRGLNPRSFDGRGNYTLGLTEHIIFPEINIEKVGKVRGMDVTIVTSARTDEEGRELLRLMNMPFRVR